MPEIWNILTLGQLCRFISGGTPSKTRPDYWCGNIPWVSPKDLKRPRLSDVVDHISEQALYEGSSLAPENSILIVVRGMILAKDVPVSLLERAMAFNQDIKALVPNLNVFPAYLLYALQAAKQSLLNQVGRSAHGTMTLMSSALEQFTIPVPDKGTQWDITSIFEVLEHNSSIYSRKRIALQDLFRTLLHQLMTAQIRVNHLDLSEMEKILS